MELPANIPDGRQQDFVVYSAGKHAVFGDATMEENTGYEVERKNRELAVLAALAMHDQRAEDIVVLDVRGLVDYADFFVVATASSLTRMRGICRRVEKVLAKRGAKRLNQPDREAAWVLADFGDVVVNIFDPDARDFYRLEDLWGDAPTIPWQERIPEK